jgi:phosphomannomutase
LSTKLFGTSGIRGSIAEKSTSDLAMKLGRALGTLLEGHGVVAVGTDARTSRVVLRNSIVSGVISTGVSVRDLGIIPMPAVAFSSSLEDIKASVIVTASHNPAGDNGFKFFTGGREFIRSEEEVLEAHITNSSFLAAPWDGVGRVEHRSLKEVFLKRIKEFLLSRGNTGRSDTRVLVDLANGAATEYTPRLLRELGFSVTSMNSHQDGHFPGRLAEPSPRNLGDAMSMAAESDFAATICHDGDGDRIAVINEKGEFVDQNRVIALFARDEVERHGGGTVLTSIDTSSVIDEIVTKAGGLVVRQPLGSLQEYLASEHGKEVVFASEPWKPIFTALGGWMDGITGAGRFSQLVHELGDGSCLKLMSSIPRYPMLRDFLPCPDEIKTRFLPRVKDLLLPQLTGVEQVLEVDGIRIERKDGSYVLVRVSGTEPKARIYVGAREQGTLDKVAAVAKDSMKQALAELGHPIER